MLNRSCRTWNILFIALLPLSLLAHACGNNSSSGSGPLASDVVYKVDLSGCLSTISGFDDVIEISAGSFLSKDYVWFCTDYDNQSDVLVTIQFDNNDDGTGCLTLEGETVATGICI